MSIYSHSSDSQEPPHDNVLGTFTNLFRCLVNPLCGFVDPICSPLDLARSLVNLICRLVDLTRGWNVASSCFMYSKIAGVGVRGGLFLGVAEDEGFFRK